VTYFDDSDEDEPNTLPHHKGRGGKVNGGTEFNLPVPLLSKMMRKNKFIADQKTNKRKKKSYSSFGSFSQLGNFGLTPQSKHSWKDDKSEKSSSINSKKSPASKKRKSKNYTQSRFNLRSSHTN
jgi:hypothetical protein